jgi:hypothetical protein
MRKIGYAAAMLCGLGMGGACAAAGENDAGLVEKRSLSPIIQIDKTIWRGGGFVWDSTSDRANGISWNIRDEVCGSLQKRTLGSGLAFQHYPKLIYVHGTTS